MALNSSDTNLSTLVVNKCTKKQYDDMTNKSINELYIVPEDIDTTPTQNSTNPVTSGGVYAALAALEQRIAALETTVNNS